MSLSDKLNPSLKSLPVYQPGRPIEEVARELGLASSEIIKVASNENPLGPSPKAVKAMQLAVAQSHLYPDGNAFYLKNKLASKLGVELPNLILGNGSNEIIEFVSHALLGPGDEIVVSQYCFAIYPLVAMMMGAKVNAVPAVDYGHDLPAMLDAITPGTRIIWVANPNNPTGTLAKPDDVRNLVESVPDDVLLVMDEAYYEFLEDPVDLLPLIRSGEKPNLLLMRTFSKIYGLAGLRIGYGIGHPELVAALEKVRQPFNTNAIAQAGAMAALEDEAHLSQTWQVNANGLRFFESFCRDNGYEFVPSYANFILVNVGDGLAVFESLQRQGVIARPMGGYGLPEWIRLSIGTETENRRAAEALKESLS
ncbi:MAG: histidinol-phosphate transaminase [Verrucomicrobiales bacterium]|nr:histidinol-phosphate transaminase [Verrucomicrobiales bacterium]|tara:strand:- start:339 stop:1436 length:1098 start_codon:yes stop_codon:yes gene_type:complete